MAVFVSSYQIRKITRLFSATAFLLEARPLRALRPHTTGCYSKLSSTIQYLFCLTHTIIKALFIFCPLLRWHEDKRPRHAGCEPIFKKVPCYNHFPINNTQFDFLQTLLLCCEATFIYCHKKTLVRWVLYKMIPLVRVHQALLYIKCNWLLVSCFSGVFVGVRWSVTRTSPRKSSSTTATPRASRWRLIAPWAPLKDPGQSACPSQSRHSNNTQISTPHLLQKWVRFFLFYFKTKKGQIISIFQHGHAIFMFSVRSVLSLWPLFLFVWNIGTPCEEMFNNWAICSGGTFER